MNNSRNMLKSNMFREFCIPVRILAVIIAAANSLQIPTITLFVSFKV